MEIRNHQSDFDGPAGTAERLASPVPSRLPQPTGPNPSLVNNNQGRNVCYQTLPDCPEVNPEHTLSDAAISTSAPHHHNLNVLRRVHGNPVVYDQDIENGRLL